MIAWQTVWWLGFAIAYVVAHFFLFCNVFRIARRPELIMGGNVHSVWRGRRLFPTVPGWIGTIVASLALTIHTDCNRNPKTELPWHRMASLESALTGMVAIAFR